MKTEVIKLDPGDIDIEAIRAAVEILDGGGLVVFPTETVYGIACAVMPESIARLDHVKQRNLEKRYTLHIGEKQTIDRYLPKISARAGKLIENAWPGPLTTVFQLDAEALQSQRGLIGEYAFEILYRDGTIGVRCPDNPIAEKLLSLVSHPVVAPSANSAGQNPAVNAEQALAQLDGKVPMILDGGQCRLKKSSTVVKITPKELTILREGAYKQERITEISTIRILFVCTGNTCRSPMAEAFCRKYISEKLECGLDEIDKFGYIISSAGTVSFSGMPASAEVIEICTEAGINMFGHRSRALDRKIIDESDFIFGLAQGHCQIVLDICPDVADKCFLLDADADVGDPIGGGMEVYRGCAEQIEIALKKRLDEILA